MSGTKPDRVGSSALARGHWIPPHPGRGRPGSAAVALLLPLLLAGGTAGSPGAAQEHSDRLRVVDRPEREQLVVELGPIDLPARTSHMELDQLPVQTGEIPFDLWIHSYHLEAVDATGSPVPTSLIHHANILEPGRRELFAPIMHRVLAAGSETKPVGLPGELFGIRMKGGTRFLALTMLHNPRDRAYEGVRVRFVLGYEEEEPVWEVYPFHMDVAFPVGSSAFDLPPGRTVKTWEGSPAVEATLLGLGGHLHDHAVELSLRDLTTGEYLYRKSPVTGPDGAVVEVPTELMVSVTDGLGPELDPDHRYQVRAVYENPTGDTIRRDAMASVAGGVLLDEESEALQADASDPVYELDRYHVLHSLEPAFMQASVDELREKFAAAHGRTPGVPDARLTGGHVRARTQRADDEPTDGEAGGGPHERGGASGRSGELWLYPDEVRAAGLTPPDLPRRTARVEVVAHPEARELELIVGPVNLEAGGHHLRLPVQLAELPIEGWIHGFEWRITDAQGRKLPDDLLHHVNLIDPDHRELFAPIARRVLAAGRETPQQSLPSLLGYPVDRGTRLLVSAMFASPDRRDYRDVSLHLRIPYSRPGDRLIDPRSVYPFYLDVMGPVGPKDFAVPPGYTEKFWEGSPAVDARVLALGGHLHDYARELRLEDVTEGEVVWRTEPNTEGRGHVVSVPTSKPWWKGGIKLRKEHTYRIVVEYYNPTDRPAPDGGMGAIGGAVLADPEAWPTFDRTDAAYVADLRNTLRAPRMLGHRHGGATGEGSR